MIAVMLGLLGGVGIALGGLAPQAHHNPDVNPDVNPNAAASVQGKVLFQPNAQEAKVPALFQLGPAEYAYRLEPWRTEDKYTISKLQFPSPIVTDFPENNTVHAEWFLPLRESRNAKVPGVVVLHILGADFALSRYMCARLADHGVAALFVKMPFYGERRPPGMRGRFLSEDLDRSVLGMRQSVCDVRRAVTWLRAQPEVDPEALGVTGISLGAIVAALAAAVDPAIAKASLLLVGGDLAEILWTMNETEARAYRAKWLASGRTRADLNALTIPYDPLTYAESLKTKKIMMIAGNADDVIPPACALKLWHAAGKPQLLWADCGHYSAVGYLLPGIRQTVDFFATDPKSPSD